MAGQLVSPLNGMDNKSGPLLLLLFLFLRLAHVLFQGPSPLPPLVSLLNDHPMPSGLLALPPLLACSKDQKLA